MKVSIHLLARFALHRLRGLLQQDGIPVRTRTSSGKKAKAKPRWSHLAVRRWGFRSKALASKVHFRFRSSFLPSVSSRLLVLNLTRAAFCLLVGWFVLWRRTSPGWFLLLHLGRDPLPSLFLGSDGSVSLSKGMG